MFPKPKRTRNPKLLAQVKRKPCVVCGHSGDYRNPIDPSHIKTRGSGGPDTYWNVVPKCRQCHTVWGRVGPSRFFQKYPRFRTYLELLGWSWDGHRLRHPELEGGENEESVCQVQGRERAI